MATWVDAVKENVYLGVRRAGRPANDSRTHVNLTDVAVITRFWHIPYPFFHSAYWDTFTMAYQNFCRRGYKFTKNVQLATDLFIEGGVMVTNLARSNRKRSAAFLFQIK